MTIKEEFIGTLISIRRIASSNGGMELLKKMRKAGFSPEIVRSLDFSKREFKQFLLGIDFKTLREMGLKPSVFLGAECLVGRRSFKEYPLQSTWTSFLEIPDLVHSIGYTVEEIENDGLDISEIRVSDLKSAGYSLGEIKKMGCGFWRISKCFCAKELAKEYTPRIFYHNLFPPEKLLDFFHLKTWLLVATKR